MSLSGHCGHYQRCNHETAATGKAVESLSTDFHTFLQMSFDFAWSLWLVQCQILVPSRIFSIHERLSNLLTEIFHICSKISRSSFEGNNKSLERLERSVGRDCVVQERELESHLGGRGSGIRRGVAGLDEDVNLLKKLLTKMKTIKLLET